MNKNLYKVIFNKKRGQMMAVAEIAISEGKSAGETQAGSSSGISTGKQISLKVMSFSFMLALGSVVLLPVAQAEIIGDKNAPGNQRPTVLNSANGTPTVNIQTPTKGGVSMNQYQKFDVDKKGAILNNSRGNTQTQLGGWVQGNPFLATGSARVIVNQVNSANPSYLNGYIEVAGQKAEVIIANPAGLSINGGGFINASGVTLTTGTPVVSGAGVDAFRVRSGSITVGKDGLDTSGADYTRLISQALQLKGGIWAKDLKATVGTNDVAADGKVTATEASKGQPVQWGIDVAELGGMYAGKITLVSTDKGVGVNNAGQIFAGAGGVTIDANGQLRNSGSLVASDKDHPQVSQAAIRLNTTDLHNSGTLSSQGNADIASNTLGNTGLIASSQQLTLRNQGKLQNSGVVTSKRLDVQTGTLSNQQGNFIQTGLQDLEVLAGSLNNLNKGVIGLLPEGSQLPNQSSGGQAGQQVPSTAAGGGNVTSTPNVPSNTSLATGKITVNRDLSNDNGKIIANGTVDLNVTEGLVNHGQMTLGSLNVRGKSFDNDFGEIQVNNLNSETNAFSNRSGELSVQKNTKIHSQSFSNTQGKINSGGSVSIDIEQGENQQGVIETAEQLTLKSQGQFNSQKGTIKARQNIDIQAQGFNNQQGEVVSVQGQLRIHSPQGVLNNDSGHLQAAKALDINSHGLSNAKGVITAEDVKINANGHAFQNETGKVLSQIDVSVNSGSINNQKGQIQANRNLQIDSQKQQVNNLDGRLVAGANLRLQVGDLDNQQGLIAANQHISIDTSGKKLNNSQTKQSGGISAAQLDIQSGDLNNQYGQMVADKLVLNSADIGNDGGIVAASRQLDIQANNINSQSGTIQSGNNLKMTAEDVNNDEGLIYAQNAELSLKHLSNQRTNTQETGIQADQLRIDAISLNNTQGQIVSSQDLPLTVSNSLINTQGLISTNGVLTIGSNASKQPTITNSQGRIQSGKDMQVNAADLDSSGHIISNGNLKLSLDGDLNHTGTIAAQKNIDLKAADVINSGSVQAGEDLQVSSQNWNNDKGVVEANRIALDTGSLSNQSGRIQQNNIADLNVNVGAGLLNQDGVIGAQLAQAASISSTTTSGGATGGTGNTGGNGTTTGQPNTNPPVAPNQAGHINVTGQLNNQKGQILANGVTNIVGQGNLSNLQGVISVKDLQWTAANLIDNQHGHINADNSSVKTQNINNVSGEWFNQKELSITATDKINNTQGKLVTGGNTVLVAKDVVNDLGQIVASGQIDATVAQTLSNKEGNISANQSVRIKAGALDNSKGQIASAKDAVKLTVQQALLNQEGQISAAKTLDVKAYSVDNQKGVLAGDTLKLVTTAGQLSNHQGNILANSNSEINVKGLDNQNGQIHSNATLNLDTNAYLLNNHQGSITSLQSMTVNSGELKNNEGLLQSSSDVTIATAGQDLNNQSTSNKGILAGGVLSLDTGSLYNQQGTILSGKSAQVHSRDLQNASGSVQAVGDLNLVVSGDIDNQAGSLLAGKALNLQAQIVNNSQTQTNGQGIQGQNIYLQATTLNNQQGAVIADQNTTLKLRDKLDNRYGKVSAAEDLLVIGQVGSLASIVNQEGDLIAGEQLTIDTQALDNAKGKILSLGDLDLHIGNDFHTAKGQIEASGDAKLKVDGKLTNSDQLSAGGELIISSNDLVNEAQAQINAQDTQVIVKNHLNNKGLIDGQSTFIQAKEISNIGENAKIYGNHLAIKAETLLNDVDNGKAGTIAARERLDLGIRDSLRNREHGLIFSAGDMAIGGDLNASRQAIGKANEIQNNSATIESLGDMTIGSKALYNTNEHFKTEMANVSREHIIEYEAQGRNERLREGTQQELGWYVFNDESDHLRTPDGDRHENWHRYNYIRAVDETRVIETDPGKIISGGKLSINADELWNKDSQIIAGDKLTVTTNQGGLHNLETTGERIITDKGCAVEKADGSGCYANYLEAQNDGLNVSKGRWYDWGAGGVHYFWRDRDKGRDSTGHSRSDYLPAPEVTKGLSLGSFAFEEYAQSGSNNTVAAKQGIQVTGNVDQADHTSGPNAAQGKQLNQTQQSQFKTGTNSKQNAQTIDQANGQKALNQSVNNVGQVSATDAIGVTEGTHSVQQADSIANVSQKSTDSVNDVTKNQVGDAGSVAVNDVIVRTTKPNLQLPGSSIYSVNAQSGNHLIETDSKFTDYRKWLGSDYMLGALNLDPALMQKRMGDGFYEQRLLREQIASITGRRYLDGYDNDEEQFKALMDSGISAAHDLSLTPGVALSAEQIARLSSDIVWMVEQSVTLEDGSSTKVLVPQVYVRVLPGDINGNGALLSGRVSELNVNGTLTNSGTVAGRQAMRIDATTVDNINGRISAKNLNINALADINNIGGSIDATNNLLLQAGRNINNITTTTTNVNEQGSVTALNRVAGIYITGPENGVLLAQAGNNINIDAAQLLNQSVGGQTLLKAGNDINLGTNTVGRYQENRLNVDNYIIRAEQTDIGSSIQTHGEVALLAGRDINAKAVQVSSSDGQLDVIAGRDINIGTGNQHTLIDDGSKHSGRSGGGNKQVETTKITVNDQQSLASDLGGSVLNVKAGNNVNVSGSSLISDNHTQVVAGNNVEILAAEEYNQTDSFYSKKKSGLMSSGGIGFTVGSKKETTEISSDTLNHAASTVGSLHGDTNIVAGNGYTQSGSIVSSPEGNVNILAKQIDIKAAEDQYASDYKHTMEQKGFTVAVNIPVVNAIQGAVGAVKSIEKVGDSKSSRVNAMAAANSTWGAYKAGQGLAQMAQDPQGAVSQDISVSITYGEQKNVDQTKTQGTKASASQIIAGKQINIVATGAEEDSNINIIGSDVAGKGGTNLFADNGVNIKSAEQTHTERSENKSEGWNAGVAISYGQGGFAFGVTAGGNYGKGYGNGDEVTHRNSHVGDENSQTNIKSGGATNIIGGQVLGNRVDVEAAELNIASLQDTAKFKSKQQDMSAQVTVGYGFSASGSYSQSKTDADYAAVREQSGIIAGDDGYNINVKGNTDLKGAIITSTELAGSSGKNKLVTGSLSLSDIKNHADYEASGFGLEGEVSRSGSGGNNYHGQEFKNEASKSVGYGSDSGHASNVTESGVYQGNIVITDEEVQRIRTGQSTDDAIKNAQINVSSEQSKDFDGLSNNFDKDKVQAEVDLQVEVTKEFDETRQGVKKEIYGYVDKTRAKAEDIRKNNFIDGLNGYNTQESLDLEENADKWEKRAFYLDALLGGAYGWGNADIMKYVGTAVLTDPVRRAATAPEQIWIVKCNGDSLYCANNSYDGKKTRPIYDANGKIVDTTDANYTGSVEIGDKRQIFDLADIAPGNNTGVITISNPGIMNPLGDALKNAVKQNDLVVTQDGIVVINNPKTTNLVSELLYAAYDKTNDLIGGRLPLTSSEKANIKLYEYAKDNGFLLDLSNHSRGGLTASVALQNANRNGLTEIPIRESRFYGTATYVPDYANQLVTNGFTYTIDGKEYGSAAYSAVHYTDFVGRSPLIAFRSKYIVGGNKPTGGKENGWFDYSHSSYEKVKPKEILIDNQGNYIDENGYRVSTPVKNPYYKQFEELWLNGKNHNQNADNPSLPVLVEPEQPKKGIVYNEKSH